MSNIQRNPVPGDFNGDGQSDLLLQNDDGTLFIYGLNGLSVTSGFKVGSTGPTFHAGSTADINGDGQPDIILQDQSGDVFGLQMNGTTLASGQFLVYGAGNGELTGRFRGAADFTGDGKADMVMQLENGRIRIWSYSSTYQSYQPQTVGTLPSGWTVEGVADFNGDGHPDLLVQNTGGEIVTYLMNGTIITSGHSLGNPGTGWSVAGTGNYNGDGKADILLHNDGGGNVIWETNGSSVTGAANLGNPGPSWTGVVAGLDLNGDGASDLVLQNQDSTLVGFTLDNTATVTAGTVLGAPGAGWRAVGNNPVWYSDVSFLAPNSVQTATIGVDQFDFSAVGTGAHFIAGFDPAQDTVVLSKSAYPTYAAVQAAELPYQGGTFIGFGTTAALVIQGQTPDKLTAANFVFR